MPDACCTNGCGKTASDAVHNRTGEQALLDVAAIAQTAYWDALRKLETAIGVDLDDVGELSGLTVQEVIDSFGPDGFGGVDDAEADDENILCECGRDEKDCAVFYGAEKHRDRS